MVCKSKFIKKFAHIFNNKSRFLDKKKKQRVKRVVNIYFF